ncbi:MAG: YqgE/AlgH family protein [Pseudomonadota bacterium]
MSIGNLQSDSEYQGRFLVAMPGMPDPRFQHTLIYICSHSSQGAMGLVANQRHDDFAFHELLRELSLTGEEGGTASHLVSNNRDGPITVFSGGPVEQHRGFVLHSNDFFVSTTVPVSGGVALTTTLDVLRQIARGTGPSRALIAMGYSGWGAGQLEEEIADNGWLVCPADPDVLFSAAPEDRYRLALSAIGVDATLLSAQIGHA